MLAAIFATPSDISHVLYAIIAGLLPALLWLLFWLREDNLHPEPRGRLAACFIGGMIAVLAVLPFQYAVLQMVQHYHWGASVQYTLWAVIEEIMKFLCAYYIAIKTRVDDEPVDPIIYMITAALGFAAGENILYLLHPTGALSSHLITYTLIQGNLRFLGASLLHVLASGTVGIMLGITFYRTHKVHRYAGFAGLCIASALHTAFNLFIINKVTIEAFPVFYCVWLGIIGLLLAFEYVKHIPAVGITSSNQL
jgi:RsiW-degrading membrane proteinase PrsW (M82 family)